MRRSLRIPIRYKILVALLLVVTAVVSAITFTMAHLFHVDKKIYVSDLTSVLAVHAADEASAILKGYRERLETITRILEDPAISAARRTELVRNVIRNYGGMIAVTFYEGGREVGTLYDGEALAQAGISPQAMDEDRRAHPLAADALAGGRLYVANSTLSERLPALTLGLSSPRAAGRDPIVVVATVRLEELLRVSRRSTAIDVFFVDGGGSVLSHKDLKQVAEHRRVTGLPALSAMSRAMVWEYEREGVDRIGGFARIGNTDLLAVAEVPKAAAYFASRELLRELMAVALALLMIAALVGMLWSHQLTDSITRLVHASRVIGKGDFNVRVQIRSQDEIGTLAESFNQMATELYDRERALKEAQAQLIQSEKLAAFGQLGAGVAHEIKNPLAGILGVVQLMRRETKQADSLGEGLAMIEKETRRCKEILDNLLRFARQEKVSFAPVEVSSVIKDAVAIMSHQLSLHQVKLEADVAPALAPFFGNANQIQQVLMNLILNAEQAMAGRGGQVQVGARAVNGRIEIRVADSGPGIAKELQHRIFEPFFSTKETGKGTGLGLSVSYGIVQEHKGTIAVESEPGAGATFIICLPIMDTAAADGEGEGAAAVPLAPAA